MENILSSSQILEQLLNTQDTDPDSHSNNSPPLCYELLLPVFEAPVGEDVSIHYPRSPGPSSSIIQEESDLSKSLIKENENISTISDQDVMHYIPHNDETYGESMPSTSTCPPISQEALADREEAANENQRMQVLKRKTTKENRLRGAAYTGYSRDKSGQINHDVNRNERGMLERCIHTSSNTKSKRSFLCGQITTRDREKVFKYFWDLPSWEAKKAYVKGLVTNRHVIKRRKLKTSEKKKQKKMHFQDCHLPTADGQHVRVCRTLFLNTLGIKRDSFLRWTSDQRESDDGAGTDDEMPDDPDIQPNISAASNDVTSSSGQFKYAANKRKYLLEWLAVIPKVPSHYCRSSTGKTYVESGFLSFQNMHGMYREWCEKKEVPHGSRPWFVAQLDKEKIGIHMPRKDQCDTCHMYKSGNLELDKYTAHLKMKEEAFIAKAAAKENASETHHVITMDVQSVLLAPKLEASALYYKRKLQIHNFTTYCLKNGDVNLYIWHEASGGVSASSFVSCIVDYIENLPPSVTHVTLISDGCGYQNRNKVLASALSTMAKTRNLTIEQLYLEKGHTVMEVDSVHSTLEHYFKAPLYVPSDFIARARLARRKQPYVIHHLDHTFFKNYEAVSTLSSLRPGKVAGDPSVTDIRALKYLTDGSIHFRLRHTSEYQLLPIRKRRSASGSAGVPPVLYPAPTKISAEKYKDLLSLTNLIPKDYHSFYNNLPHEK